MYPLFNFAIDTASSSSSDNNDDNSHGMGSSLSPNMMLALSVLKNISGQTNMDTTTNSRMAFDMISTNNLGVVSMVGSIVGGLVGGKWMQHYFPDDDSK